MSIQLITSDVIARFIHSLESEFNQPGTIFLIGETSLVVEGYRRYTDRIDFCSSVEAANRSKFNSVVRSVAAEMDLKVTDEFPGEVIPLPEGYDERRRDLSDDATIPTEHFSIFHFDPYSVSFRFIARGSEPDYHVVLKYLEHEWISESEVNERLEGLLPAFSFETIQQDPAEFRRRLGGLWQMWNAKKVRMLGEEVAG